MVNESRERPRTSTDSSGRPSMAARTRWDFFPPVPVASGTGGRSADKTTDEKRQLQLILAELRKELTRMDYDDWRYPSTSF